MPITAKLSREFYERFGDKVVNEMVDLFNRIDDAARADLRYFNEQNALRFEAKLDQRTAELRAEIEKLGVRVDARINGLDERLTGQINALDERLTGQINALDERRAGQINALLERIDAHEKHIDLRIDALAANNKAILEKSIHAHTRWMIGMWATVIASQIALWLR